MRCSRVQYLYEEYTAGSLAPATASLLDEHLSVCPPCREFYESNDDLAQIISTCDEIPHPGPDYLNKLSANVLGNLFDDETGEFRKFDGPAPQMDERSVIIEGWRRPLWWTGGLAAASLLVLALGPGVGALMRGESQSANLSAGDGSSMIAQAIRHERPPSEALQGAAKLDQRSTDMEQRQIASAQGAPGPRPATSGSLPYQRISLPVGFGSTADLALVLNASAQSGTSIDLRPPITSSRRSVVQPNDPAMAGSGQTRWGSDAQVEPISGLQSRLVRQGRRQAQFGRFEAALAYYHRAFEIEPSTEIALEACLRMADINFGPRGDFSSARDQYRLCDELADATAFSGDQLQHIKRQLALLDHFASDDWQCLSALFGVARGPWEEVVPQLGQILSDERADCLVKEATSAVVDRLEKGERPPEKIAAQLAELLETRAPAQPSAQAQAWTQLAAADFVWLQFGDLDRAIQNYNRVAQFEESGLAATEARRIIRRLSAGDPEGAR